MDLGNLTRGGKVWWSIVFFQWKILKLILISVIEIHAPQTIFECKIILHFAFVHNLFLVQCNYGYRDKQLLLAWLPPEAVYRDHGHHGNISSMFIIPAGYLENRPDQQTDSSQMLRHQDWLPLISDTLPRWLITELAFSDCICFSR